MKNTDSTSQDSPNDMTCSACHSTFQVVTTTSQTVKYCPFCNRALYPGLHSTIPLGLTNTFGNSTTLVKGHIPEAQNIQFSIGPYQILNKIGSGGMGEVFLAYDTNCGRRIALKRIREDLTSHIQMHQRFLKEARITSQLTHPGIIPIYTIHEEERLVYYTMPFVEGKTLKQIFLAAKALEKKSGKPDHIESSIPSLIRIFLTVCQAIAYSHSKNVLHRDLKPDNIIVGPYGEVLILDWGLAKMMDSSLEQDDSIDETIEDHPLHELTHVGRVVGTVAYMAPERALGQPATFQTDIYSLGVILYQILTLHHPFRRGTLKEFRKNVTKEALFDPAQIAPYRDVPPLLSHVALKCLSAVTEERYQSVDELIMDLENYIEGRSDWFQIAELSVQNKNDWEFQENILMAEHMAITRGTDISNWVILMISKASFTENIKIEATLQIGPKGSGVGFLFSIPEMAERTHLISGYCLWVGSDLNKSTKLLRSTVEVVHEPDIYLQRNVSYHVRIEKIEHNIHFYLNDVLQFSYISHQPLVGTHLGLLAYDADFTISDFFVSVGSQNIKVNCLAVPDAFLAHKDYAAALNEYRRIGYSFPGRAESREGLFRAGITLLEQARNTPHSETRDQKFNEALDEFSKLHNTPGAPLEYLGKALVYQALEDDGEEIKCFELAFRRYPNHPLLSVLQEHIVYRMHESSRYYRKTAYNFILLTVRYLPKIERNNPAKKLISSLKRHWEPLYFIEETQVVQKAFQKYEVSIPLAFWLANPHTLDELINELEKATKPDFIAICNALFCLIQLGAYKLAQETLSRLSLRTDQSTRDSSYLKMIQIALDGISGDLKSIGNQFIEINRSTEPDTTLQKYQLRTAFSLIENGLARQETAWVQEFIAKLRNLSKYTQENKIIIDSYSIWAHLIDNNWSAANPLFLEYSLEQLTQETTLLHFLYGCWLYVTEGKEIAQIHFSSILEVSYPRTWTLFSHFAFNSKKEQDTWLQKAFLWEKRHLYRQYKLFNQCIGNQQLAKSYLSLEKETFLND